MIRLDPQTGAGESFAASSVPPGAPPIGPVGKPMVPRISKDLSISGNKSARGGARALTCGWIGRFAWGCLIGCCVLAPRAWAADHLVAPSYAEDVQPILEQYCYACHGLGAKKGGVALDEFANAKAAQSAPKLWHAVLKNVRSGIMPPAEKPRPSDQERRLLEDWIKRGAFGIDPKDPDPGRVTVRRLNRVEYRNTIRDLIGVEYDTTSEFPADDTGNGFDNNGDVLTLSPLLLEKYLALPIRSSHGRCRWFRKFPLSGRSRAIAFESRATARVVAGPSVLSYYEPASATSTVMVEHVGRYRLILDLKANERYVDGKNDYNRCQVLFLADGEELLRREFARQDNKPFRFEFDRDWKAGRTPWRFRCSRLRPNRSGSGLSRSASSR